MSEKLYIVTGTPNTIYSVHIDKLYQTNDFIIFLLNEIRRDIYLNFVYVFVVSIRSLFCNLKLNFV